MTYEHTQEAHLDALQMEAASILSEYTTCPWCECSSRTPDFCSECGEDIYGEEGIERCIYCGNERGSSFSCCGEVHFEKKYHMENCK